MSKFRNSHFLYIALLLMIAVIGYWQLSLLRYSVTHDMINCWIPWRFYISECLQNHMFPFWNPYQQLGYPIHADLQGPSWYLESLILGSTIGMSNYVVQLLFVFYTFLAGVGMYFLSLCFHENRKAAFITGVCYMLSGFFVSHVQHFYAVIGAAWLPFIILNYYKMYVERSYKRAIYAAVVMFFNLTGGNHTFTFILFYLFAAIAIYFFIVVWREKRKEIIVHLLKLNALFLSLTVMMASVLFVIFVQVKPYVGRLSGMDYAQAAVNPLSPQSLLSLLLPFSTVNSVDFFRTDASMCNLYIGVILIPFLLLSFFRKRSAIENILLVFAVICLLASFGSYTPVHKFLFNFVPFMGLFRFPSYFSLFSVMIFLVLGGKQLAASLSSFTISRHILMRITLALIALMFILIVVALVKNNGAAMFFFQHYEDIFQFIASANFWQNIILQSLIQLIVLSGLLLALWKFQAAPMRIITVFAVLDMIISAQLNIAYVGFSPLDPKVLHDYVKTLPKGFPIPEMNNISENTEEKGQKGGLYRNTSVFHKRISAEVFNTFCFSTQGADSLRPLYNELFKNPLAYFSQIYGTQKQLRERGLYTFPHTTVIEEADLKKISLRQSGATEFVKVIAFQPDRITLLANSSGTQLLTLLQCHYPGWKAYIDGKETEIFRSNYLTMSIVFPQGKEDHTVEFIYRNKPVIIAGTISYLSFALVMLWISIIWIREHKRYLLVGAIWFVLLGSAIHFFFG